MPPPPRSCTPAWQRSAARWRSSTSADRSRRCARPARRKRAFPRRRSRPSSSRSRRNSAMPDALGWRKKFAVLVPSTNTSVQPEFDGMRPAGVTNHISRIRIPNMPLQSNDDFKKLIELIVVAQMEAVDSAMSMEPDRLVLGISAESFWDGYSAAKKLKKDLEDYTKLDVSMGSDAAEGALNLYGVKRIGVITPYFPVGDQNVVRFFEEGGFKVAKIVGLKCESPVAIAHV